jgi:glyoxylase-like metal-dependent hydrolase (beta-lactamase superfamily II)
MANPDVTAFFDKPTNTVSYVVACPETQSCAIIDSVLDYDPDAGRTSTASAEEIMTFLDYNGLKVEWILETHVHADHLSAAPFLKQKTGAKVAIGSHITDVQDIFGKLFNAGAAFKHDGSQFDELFSDNQTFNIGHLKAKAIHTPGHTPACMSYIIGDTVFVGDTLFMPDYGTARADFPGGDARTLHRSIQRLFKLPPDTRVFLCHDYLAPGRDEHAWETTIGAQKAHNVHVHDGISEDEFVAMREARDATLDLPHLILPSVQVNMRAGEMPPPEDNGQRYLKIPIDAL